MTRTALALAAGLLLGPAGAADKPTAPPAKPAAPDWSDFRPYDEVEGVVVKAGEKGLTLRLSWLAPSGSGRSRRGGGVREQHQNYDLTFADAGTVRWYKRPAGASTTAAARSDLRPGQVVDVVLVRPRDVKDDKLSVTDLRIKRATITQDAPADSKPSAKK